ncbi:DUF1330 domain-containing protein [bacterium SCSIO 12741]|nr:DUF1330 domain-containing protein [bacterium SCSIO 12741]
MQDKKYLDATPEAGRDFYINHQEGAVVMLNLLKFKAEADYEGLDHLAPDEPITGKEAYREYMSETMPYLQAAGSEVLFYGSSSAFVIGPADESWDAVLLVKHASAAQFIAFAQNEDYLKIAGHRKAALEDSRLLPIKELPLDLGQ